MAQRYDLLGQTHSSNNGQLRQHSAVSAIRNQPLAVQQDLDEVESAVAEQVKADAGDSQHRQPVEQDSDGYPTVELEPPTLAENGIEPVVAQRLASRKAVMGDSSLYSRELERQGRNRDGQARKSRRLVAFDVDLDEGRPTVLPGQIIQGGLRHP
jgi:hypothetical protein